MRKFCGRYPVTDKKHISDSIIKLTIRSEDIAKSILPGQFVQIRISEEFTPLWPRPFSIFDYDSQKGEISIVFKVAGRGTEILAKYQTGDPINIFGPLGNGFDKTDGGGKLVMAAGGVGLPPLYLFSKISIQNGFDPRKILFISGAKSSSELFDCGELNDLGTDLRICTDDGSTGERGTVVDLLKKYLDEKNGPVVYACGPSGMLEKIDRLLIERNIPGFLSLEQLMPCGYGICSGCAVKVYPSKDRGPTDDNKDYNLKRVCVEGPVFEKGEVIWESNQN